MIGGAHDRYAREVLDAGLTYQVTGDDRYAKHGRDKSALPQGAGHPPEGEKEQDHGDRVQRQVGKVVSARLEAVDLRVQHVRKKGQWMPVCSDRMSKRPFCSLNADAAHHLGVSIDVRAIVEIHELVSERLSENGPDEHNEQKAGRDGLAGGNPMLAHGLNR